MGIIYTSVMERFLQWQRCFYSAPPCCVHPSVISWVSANDILPSA